MKFTNDKPSAKYSEIGQLYLTRWAILKEECSGLLTWKSNFFKCRDFFSEFVCGMRMNKHMSIYGFKWDGTTDSNSKMVLAVHSHCSETRFCNIVALINKEIGRDVLTVLESVNESSEYSTISFKNLDKIYYVRLEDQDLVRYPFYLHVITFLLKMASHCEEDYATLKEYISNVQKFSSTQRDNTNAQTYVQCWDAAFNTLKKLINSGYYMDKWFSGECNRATSLLHNCTGAESFLKYVKGHPAGELTKVLNEVA